MQLVAHLVGNRLKSNKTTNPRYWPKTMWRFFSPDLLSEKKTVSKSMSSILVMTKATNPVKRREKKSVIV